MSLEQARYKNVKTLFETKFVAGRDKLFKSEANDKVMGTGKVRNTPRRQVGCFLAAYPNARKPRQPRPAMCTFECNCWSGMEEGERISWSP